MSGAVKPIVVSRHLKTMSAHPANQGGKAAGTAAGETVVQTCPSCGKKNRIVRARASERPLCGHCKEPVFGGTTLAVTDASFGDDVERSPIPVLVDFWAPWCGPCRAVAPMLDKLASEHAGTLKIAKLNVDENPQMSARFQVQAIPTMIVFRDGQVVDQIRGALPKPALDARLGRLGI
jgi:thioredoxin 2